MSRRRNQAQEELQVELTRCKVPEAPEHLEALGLYWRIGWLYADSGYERERPFESSLVECAFVLGQRHRLGNP